MMKNKQGSIALASLLIIDILLTGVMVFSAATVKDVTKNLGSGGYTRINASDAVTSVVNDTNVTGSIASGILTLGWTGTLADGRVANDITLDNLTQVTTRAISDTTGTLAVGRGGTGGTTYQAGQFLVGNGTSAITATGTSPFTVDILNATSSTATSTFFGGVSTGGLSTSNGLVISSGILSSSVSATSSLTGGLSVGSLVSSGGLTLTGGSLNATVALATTNLLTVSGATTVGTSTFSGNLAVGTTTARARASFDGQVYVHEVIKSSNSGAIDWSQGNQQTLVMTGNTTLTFANPNAGGAYRLNLCQDATGGRTSTFPDTATILWNGSTTPVRTTLAGDCDVVSCIYTNGTSTPKYFCALTKIGNELY